MDVDEKGNVTTVESITNPLTEKHNPGELPSFIKSKNVNVVITGGMGPKAQQYFASYGIKPVVGAYGRVKDVLEEYLQKKIQYVPPSTGGTFPEKESEPENDE
ncbi:MAG: dinitrogenase iron-molybdenum cofactor, partial [Candidatus Hydrothermota bacterium]